MSHVDLLRQVPLFSTLSDEDLARIGDRVHEAAFEEGDSVFSMGETGDTLYLITEGSVRILYPGRSQELELARLGPGDFFGEMALLNDEPRSATVIALTPIRVLVLGKAEFRELVADSGEVALRLLEALSYRMRTAGAQAGELHDQMLRDPLTGLLNRRAFRERLQEEVNRAQRYGEAFSLLILDVDQFKVVNDTFGHDAGDQVLQWLGRILIEHTRAADAPFRIGGEEFAILAPAADAEVARSIGDRIRAHIADGSPPLGPITASIGFATCPSHARRPETLFRLADQAVLRAKAQGRDRVEGPDRTVEESPASAADRRTPTEASASADPSVPTDSGG